LTAALGSKGRVRAEIVHDCLISVNTPCTAAYLGQAGVPNTHIRLADLGVHGNGHMMMIEKNNAAITSVSAQWLERQRLREGQSNR